MSDAKTGMPLVACAQKKITRKDAKREAQRLANELAELRRKEIDSIDASIE